MSSEIHITHKVIIWATDNYNSLALLRQISQANVQIDFIINGKAGCTIRSKYIQKWVETSSYDEAYNYLMGNYSKEERKPVIITSGDGIIAYIDQRRETFLRFFIVPGTSKSGLVTRFNDKCEMTNLAEQVGIVVPKSYQICWSSETKNLPYPLMLKPSHEKQGMHNEFKFRICRNQKDLDNTLKYVHHESVFIAQELVNKECDLLVYGARMFDGKVVLAGSLETKRFATGQGSSFGKVHSYIPSCISIKSIEDFLAKIDYFGLFSFEYGLRDGKAYFFEVNLRNDATSCFFFQSGANIPLAYTYNCSGMDYNTIPTKVSEERYYMDEIYDKINIWQGKIKRKEWKQERAKVSAFKFYDQQDIKPYEYEMQGSTMKMLRDLFIYKFRLYILWILNILGIKK